MTRIVDCDAIRRGRRLSDPFEWATLQGALSRGTGAALWESSPQDGFTQVCSSSLTKPSPSVEHARPSDRDARWRGLLHRPSVDLVRLRGRASCLLPTVRPSAS